MRRMRWITGLLAASLLAGPAWGQAIIGKIGKRAPDFKFEDSRNRDIKFSLDQLRGRIVVFYCWRASSAESLELMSKMREIDAAYRPRGVRMVSVSADSREKTEEVLRERGADFFHESIYYGGTFQMVYGAMSHPEVVIVDPYGYLVWRGHPLDNLQQRLDDIIEYTPPHSGNTEWLAQRLRSAERLSGQGDYARAWWMARNVFELTDEGSSEHGSAEGLMKQIEEAARVRIPAALEAERAGQYDKAAALLADISVRMDKSDLAKDVNNEIGRMRGDRNMKVAIRNAIHNAKGEVLMDEAADLEEFHFYHRAADIYDQILQDESYDETPVVEKAEAALERLKTDPKIRERIADRLAQEQLMRWLDLGDRLAKLGLHDLARERYERIIQQDAKSKWGQRAAERLAKLPRAEVSKDAGKPAGG